MRLDNRMAVDIDGREFRLALVSREGHVIEVGFGTLGAQALHELLLVLTLAKPAQLELSKVTQPFSTRK